MRVTVMSPVTAEVTIAQASAWLERAGWRRVDAPIVSGLHSWERDDEYLWMPNGESDEDSRAMAELIVDVARAVDETPAYVLQEMSEVRL